MCGLAGIYYTKRNRMNTYTHVYSDICMYMYVYSDGGEKPSPEITPYRIPNFTVEAA